jgi:4-hydroxybutyrate CoA-transferase
MRRVSAAEAIATIEDGSTVVFPAGTVEPRSLFEAFSADVDRFRSLRVYSGLSFGSYSFLERGLGDRFRYATWQASPKLRRPMREGRIDVVPMRYADVPRLVRRGGAIDPDVFVTQVSPPRRGRVSLGISVGLQRHFAEQARVVIAEMNPRVPWTGAASTLPVERIDLAVESDAPLLEYRTAAPSERDVRIVDHVLSLVPERATVQLGVGAVPDRVLARLAEIRGVRLFSGMLSQGLLEFLDATGGGETIVTGELAGHAELYERADRNPRIRMAPVTVTHDVLRLARIPRFVSVNSAIEVDLMGQANGETIDGVQVSGVGGSLDFVEGAALGEGGVSILALPSTTDDGSRSRIVARLGEGAVVTTPRFCLDAVVTEWGVARLRGRSLAERAEALRRIAHPDHRARLD